MFPKEPKMEPLDFVICDVCGQEIPGDEANYDAFCHGVLCNECYAEAMWEIEDEGEPEAYYDEDDDLD